MPTMFLKELYCQNFHKRSHILGAGCSVGSGLEAAGVKVNASLQTRRWGDQGLQPEGGVCADPASESRVPAQTISHLAISGHV